MPTVEFQIVRTTDPRASVGAAKNRKYDFIKLLRLILSQRN